MFPLDHSEQLAKDLWQATAIGDINTVTTLIEKGADPNHRLYWSNEWRWRRPPLHLACKNGELPITRILVERSGANVNRGDGELDRSPLHWACTRGHKDLIKYLTEEAKCNVGEYQYLTIYTQSIEQYQSQIPSFPSPLHVKDEGEKEERDYFNSSLLPPFVACMVLRELVSLGGPRLVCSFVQ